MRNLVDNFAFLKHITSNMAKEGINEETEKIEEACEMDIGCNLKSVLILYYLSIC